MLRTIYKHTSENISMCARDTDNYIKCRVSCGWGVILMPPAQRQFTFDGIHAFLTYPQCPLGRQELRDFLVNTVGVQKYLIARERHSDGNHHLHAYIHFGRRRRFTHSTAFDVGGHHPNIQTPRSARSVIAYCCKEDAEPLANFDHRAGEPRVGWGDILARSTSRREFLDLCRECFPRDYVLHLGQILEFCEHEFGVEETQYGGRRRDEFQELPTLTSWVNDYLSSVGKLYLS